MLNNIILEEVEANIGKKRFEHSIRVGETAKQLASIYGEDSDKAYIAGILHDCGKLKKRDALLKKVQNFDIILNDIEKHNLDLVHGKLGSKIAELEYNIDDQDILNAISYHTTARKDMSKLEKIIYISDYIEPKRNFTGLDHVRELAFIDIDASILLAIDQTIKFLIDRGRLISLDSIEARNQLKIERES